MIMFRNHIIVSFLCMLMAGCAAPGSQPNDQPPSKAPTPDPVPSQEELLISSIKKDIASDRLSTPADNSAMQKLGLLSKIAPEHPAISRYRDQIAKRYVTLAEAALGRNDYIKASTYAVKAEDINRNAEGLNDILTRIQNYPKRVSPTPVPELVPPRIDTATLDGMEALDTIPLLQTEVENRKFELRYRIDLVIEKIVKNNSLLLLTSQSEADARWLSSVLKSRIRLSYPHYELLLFVKIDTDQEPHFDLYPRIP